MSVTFAQAASAQGAAWCVLVRVEGWGTLAGSYTFTGPLIPDYASGDALYRPLLVSFPEFTSERSDPTGARESDPGASVLELLDGSDLVSSLIQTDRVGVTRLATAVDDNDATFVFADDPALGSEGTFWVGREAVNFYSHVAESYEDCTRGELGTTPQSHAAGSIIYTVSPVLAGRRVSVYLVPQRAASAAEEYLVGEFSVKSVSLDPVNLGVWKLECDGQLRYLSRYICSQPVRKMAVNGSSGAIENEMLWHLAGDATQGSAPFAASWSTDEEVFALVGGSGGEIVRLDVPQGAGYVGFSKIVERGIAGTPKRDIKGGDELTQVFVAALERGSFRYDPFTSGARGGGWATSANPVDILLCILTSSAGEWDGLELTNDDAVSSGTDWSCLAPGIGIGMPATMIDFTSFLAVRGRIEGIRLPNLYIGHESQPFLQWASENILRPLGLFLSVVDGLLTLQMPRVPTSNDLIGAYEINTASIIEILAIDYVTDGSSQVSFRGKRSDGSDATVTFQANDLVPDAAQSTYGPATGVEVPFMSAPTDPALSPTLLRQAQRLLMLYAHSYWRVRLLVDLSAYELPVGGFFVVSHPDLPTLSGPRGWTQVACLLIERTMRLDDERGPVLELTLITYARDTRAREVGPSAYVISSVASGGNRVVTVAAINPALFAVPFNFQGLPTEDSGAYEVGDMVQEWTSDLASKVGSARSVIETSTTTVTISGTGAVTAANWLLAADYADMVADQQSRIACMATEDLMEVASGVEAHVYGQV